MEHLGPEEDPHIGSSFDRHVSRNALITTGCTFLQLITRFFVPPIILHYVAIDVYGLWAYCFVFIAYFSISLNGISNVYVRYAAVYAAKKEYEKINALLSTGLVLAALFSAAFILLSWFFLPLFFPVLNINSKLSPTAFALIFGAILVFSLEMTLSMYKSLLQGLQRVGMQSWIQTVAQLLETVCIIIFLVNRFGIFSLLYAYSIQVIVANCACAFVCRRLIPALSIGWRHVDKSMVSLFFSFGAIIQLRTILAIVNRSLTRIFSGIFLGTGGTAFYDLGEKFPNTITSIPLSGLQVSLPANSHLHAIGETEKIHTLYVYGSRYISIISGLFLGFLTPFCWVLIAFWLGPDPKYHDVAFIFACFAIPYHISVVTGPASAVYRGINKPVIELWFGACEIGFSLLGLGVGFFLFGKGFNAINFGMGTGIILVSLGYLLLTNRYFGICQRTFCSKVFLPGFLPYALGGLLLLGSKLFFSSPDLDRRHAFFLLATGAIAYAFILFPTYYFLFLEPKERNFVRKTFKKILQASPS